MYMVTYAINHQLQTSEWQSVAAGMRRGDATTLAARKVPMKMKSNRDSSTKAMTGVERSRGPVTDDQIRQRAYEIFLARGAAPGQDIEDWLRAERELQASQNNRDQASAARRRQSQGSHTESTHAAL